MDTVFNKKVIKNHCVAVDAQRHEQKNKQFVFFIF